MIMELADKLVDLVVQLFQHHKASKKATFDDYVAPAYAAFETVHQAYLESFERYRTKIRQSPDLLRSASPLLDEIRTENRFSAHTRTKVLELAQAGRQDEVDGFIQAVRESLLRARAGEPLLPNLHPERLTQRFRNSLVTDLEAVIVENWQQAIDPYCSMPPLGPQEIEVEVAGVACEAGIPDDDPDRPQKIKAAFAVRALDRIVDEMQEAYTEVTARYLEAKQALGG